MIRSVRLLNLRRMRRQPMRVLITVIAIAAGVSLAVSVAIVTTSISRSLENFGGAISGPADLRVIGATSRAGLREDVLAKVEATEGVASAVPMVQAVTIADREPSPLSSDPENFVAALGVDCRVEAFVGRFGCSQEAFTAGAAGIPLITSPTMLREYGPTGGIRTNVGRTELAGAIEMAPLDAINRGRVVVFPMRTAQELFAREGMLDVIYVDAAPGTSIAGLQRRLEAAVGRWNGVLKANEAPPAVGQINEIFLPLFGILSMFSLGVGGVLVYNAISLSIEERRRQQAIAAALGGTGRVVVGGVLAEVGLLGAFGGVLGTLGGMVVAGSIIASLSSFTTRISGVTIDQHVTSSVWLTGIVLGVVVALVSAWLPARRALRMDVAAELSNRELRAEAAPRMSLTRALLWLGVAFIGLFGCWLAQRNGGLEMWQANVVPIAFVTCALGFIVAAGSFSALAVKAALPLLRRSDAATRLGAANLVRDPARTRVMAIAVGSAVAVAFIVASFNRSVEEGITRSFSSGRADQLVRAAIVPPNNAINIDAKLPPPVIEQLRAVPGVARLERSAVLLAGHEIGNLVGVIGFERPYRGLPMLDGTWDDEALRDGEVVIGPGLARLRGLRAGSTYELMTPDGFKPVKVMGVWENGDFGGRHVFMTLSRLEELYGPQAYGDVYLTPARGVSPDELVSRVHRAGLDPAVQAQTPDVLLANIIDELGYQLGSFWAIQRGLMVVAFVAVLATLLLMGVQRRRELGLLGAVGMQPTELGRMVVAEAAVVGITGTVLAVIGGVGIILAFLAITPVVIGYRDPFTVDLGTAAVYGLLVTVIVIVAALMPAVRAARVNLVEALQYE